MKKQDEYEKDHRTLMENPHAFRNNWAKKKARANWKSRRKLDALVRTERDVTPSMVKVATGPKVIRKNFVTTLGRMVQFKRERRPA